MVLIRTFLRNFNNNLLKEEFDALMTVSYSMQLAGFERRDSLVWSPALIRKLINRHSTRGVVISEDWAEPGEVFVKTGSDLDAHAIAAIDTLLTDHDETGRTAAQARDDQDGTDVAALEAEYRNWDSLTNQQRNAALKLSVRLGLRRYDSEV